MKLAEVMEVKVEGGKVVLHRVSTQGVVTFDAKEAMLGSVALRHGSRDWHSKHWYGLSFLVRVARTAGVAEELAEALRAAAVQIDPSLADQVDALEIRHFGAKA